MYAYLNKQKRSSKKRFGKKFKSKKQIRTKINVKIVNFYKNYTRTAQKLIFVRILFEIKFINAKYN